MPKFRDWVTFYGDAFVDDEITPIAYFDRSAIRAGLYFSRLPRLPKLDLRIEGVYTDLPAGGRLSHGFFYSNDRYLNGYTSQGQLLGSWIGRQGTGRTSLGELLVQRAKPAAAQLPAPESELASLSLAAEP